jgi:hypothetical protein
MTTRSVQVAPYLCRLELSGEPDETTQDGSPLTQSSTKPANHESISSRRPLRPLTIHEDCETLTIHFPAHETFENA